MRLHSCTKFVTRSLERDVMDVTEGFPSGLEMRTSTSYEFAY